MAESPACIPNIGARGIRERRTSGWVALAASAVLAVALIHYDVPRWSRLLVFLPLIAAGLGFFQASEKT